MERIEKEFEREWEEEMASIKQVMGEYRAMAELVKDLKFIELAREEQRLENEHEEEWSALRRRYLTDKGKASTDVNELIRLRKKDYNIEPKVADEVARELHRAAISNERKTGKLGKIEAAQRENYDAVSKLLNSKKISFHWSRYDESMLNPAYWMATVESYQRELDKLGTKEQYVKRKMRKKKRQDNERNIESRARAIVEELTKGD